jgi:hypothetical protein
MIDRDDGWPQLYDDLGDLCQRLWDRSTALIGLSVDPKMVSTQIFIRVYGHARAFSLLWSNHLNLDAEIILRSAIEAAICLAHLEARRAEFVADLRSDAAFTTRGQIPLWFYNDDRAAAKARAQSHEVFGQRTSLGQQHTKLDWKTLASDAGIPDLYAFYKHLSGTRAHITGLSMIGDAVEVGVNGQEEQVRLLRRLQRESALRMMCGALQISCNRHARLAEFTALEGESTSMMNRMATLSAKENVARDADLNGHLA